tara:strand:- start:1645 stop:2157 length:513 start_codon:yes stop_codon:yes gene_type:complete
LSQELITYIVLGSSNRLKNLKKPYLDNSEEYIFANFTDKDLTVATIDNLVAKAKGRIIVLLPPSCIPNKRSKNVLKKISMIDISTWGWFEINNKENDILKSFRKLSTKIRSIPSIEQGIYFNKRLYFSVGGIGELGSMPFKEISKRFYTRIDPQNPLPSLIIRTKNFNLF